MRIMMKSGLFLVSVGLLLMQAGCTLGIFGLATNGTRQKVFIDTYPSGARVELEGQVATTPAQFSLKRRRNYQAMIFKQGYLPSSVYINKDVDALVLFLDGLLLPFLFGTAWDLEPERTTVTLTPESGQAKQ